MTWQPIKTVPKNQWVLVCDEHTGNRAVWKTYLLTTWNDGGEYWSTDICGMGGYECEVDIIPTHWQLLPEPPVKP